MHMHPTVTHAAADHRRQHNLAEAEARWNNRPVVEQLTIRRRPHLVWRVTTAVDSFLTRLTWEFYPTTPTSPMQVGSPPSISGPR